LKLLRRIRWDAQEAQPVTQYADMVKNLLEHFASATRDSI
jgi:hypothetical protein